MPTAALTPTKPPAKQPAHKPIPLHQQFAIFDRPPGSLDPQESPVDPASVDRLGASIRFGRGEFERIRWLEALDHTDMPWKQREAFRHCGDHPTVEYDPETERVRLRTTTCKSRFCPACRKHRQWKWRRTILAAVDHLPTAAWKFITLTLQHRDAPLKDQLHFLRRSFRKLRQTQLWKKAIAWGIAVIEVSYNGQTHTWHPHLHLLAPCRFIDYSQLRKAWIRATAGSHVIDVQEVKSADHAVTYLAKYLGKAPSPQILLDEDRIAEYYAAMANAKLLLPFGSYPEAARPTKPEPSITKWETLGTLAEIVHLAAAHYRPAQIALQQLTAALRVDRNLQPALDFNTTDHTLRVLLNEHPPDP